MLFQCPLELIAALMTAVAAVLAQFEMKLQQTKCQLHIPALAATPVEQWPEEARAVGETLPIAHEGLTVLGTESAGEYALPLGPWAAAAAETRKRASRACRLANAALQLVRRPPAAGGKQVAYRIIRNIVSHALDYDARVLTSSLVLPHARQVEERCWHVLEAVAGTVLTDAQRAQVELPTSMGGLQMPMPMHMVPLARAACLIEAGPAIRATIASWGFGVHVAQAMDGVEDAIAEGLAQDLLAQGISIGPDGAPLPEPLSTPQDGQIMRPPVPHRHLLGSMLRHAVQHRYEKLFADSVTRDRTRLLSAGGPTAGKSLVAPAGLKQAHFSDVILTQILRWRLGIEGSSPVRQCCNVKADGDPCEEALGVHADHAVICPCGPLRIQRHDAYADTLSECIAETGAHVRREAWVGELATEQSEAILDIWAFGSADVEDLLLDVTIRHPVAAAYQPQASQEAGHAAATAAKQKLVRYPAAGGRSVTPFAVETWGRLDYGAELVLESLAAAAARHAALRGQAPPPGGCLKRWRAALDAVVQRGVAMAVLSARTGLAGRRHHSQRGQRSETPAPLVL